MKTIFIALLLAIVASVSSADVNADVQQVCAYAKANPPHGVITVNWLEDLTKNFKPTATLDDVPQQWIDMSVGIVPSGSEPMCMGWNPNKTEVRYAAAIACGAMIGFAFYFL
jgi:hypothetical protein